MGWLENVIIENKDIENERLELTDKGALYFLGPNLTLRHCTLALKVSARNLHIKRVRFIDCAFEVKQQLTNHQEWIFASIEGCRFKGRFLGCEFGHWPDYGKGCEFGSIKDCDFTEARLDACRFHGCDTRTLRFPRWPCFTIVDPIRHAPDLNSVRWPELFGGVIIENLPRHPPSTTALTYHAPSVAKRMETTEEELRAVIEKFDFIIY
jgi:hypothetical protein